MELYQGACRIDASLGRVDLEQVEQRVDRCLTRARLQRVFAAGTLAATEIELDGFEDGYECSRWTTDCGSVGCSSGVIPSQR